ncbi:MAG TPA: hypothetical protein VGR97_11475 [Candidatus Acidoferrales bacterium]|nr:hypothetical protein [Candidatus Acidoferrales bacterium]
MAGGSSRWLLHLSGCALLTTMIAAVPPLKAQDDGDSSQESAGHNPAAGPKAPTTPRGQKLMLKDGSFQLVREYAVQGDRVRYYSLDRSQWEEIPADLVDWDATGKAAAQEQQREAAIVAKVHNQEAARLAQPLDIDASLEVAPRIFLPPGAGLFAFDGKAVLQLPQAETNSKLSKGHFLEQVMVPVPIIPTRHNVSIHGLHAKLRLRTDQPEFYMRTADARTPDMQLIRAKAHGENRQIENVDELFGQQRATGDTISMQRWEIARGVYRFTLSKPLAPGEYALAEAIGDEGMSLYVWDFGVEAGPAPEAHQTAK